MPKSFIADKIGNSVRPALQLAHYLDIQVLTECHRNFHYRCRNPEVSIGPGLHTAIDQKYRVVYIEDGHEDELDAVWHEVMHLLCDPPGLCCNTLEQWMLLAVEYVYAKHCLSKTDLKSLSKLRSGTLIFNLTGDRRPAMGEPMNDKMMKHKFWEDALGRAVTIGLLDENYVPTFKRPDWSKLSSEQSYELINKYMDINHTYLDTSE